MVWQYANDTCKDGDGAVVCIKSWSLNGITSDEVDEHQVAR